MGLLVLAAGGLPARVDTPGASSLLPAAAAPPSPYAVLVVGLVRGTMEGSHMEDLSAFLESFPGGRPDAFSVLEMGDGIDDVPGCAAAVVEAKVVSALATPTHGALHILTEEDKATQNATMGGQHALYQHWKTDRAVELLVEHEQGRRGGTQYEYVVRVRIDSQFKTLMGAPINSTAWMPPMVDAMVQQPGAVFGNQDFMWVARRQEVDVLGRAGQTMGARAQRNSYWHHRTTSNAYKVVPHVSWARINESNWMDGCSTFVSAFPWPKELASGTEKDVRPLLNAAIDDPGHLDQQVGGEGRVISSWGPGLPEPEVQFGLVFFSSDELAVTRGHMGPLCIPPELMDIAPTKLLDEHDDRHELRCSGRWATASIP